MFSAQRVSISILRVGSSIRPVVPVTSTYSFLLTTMYRRTLFFAHYPSMTSASATVNSITKNTLSRVTISQTSVFGTSGIMSRIVNMFDSTIARMSSTMKKRRAKMNKHKLRKRRKLLRRKSKG